MALSHMTSRTERLVSRTRCVLLALLFLANSIWLATSYAQNQPAQAGIQPPQKSALTVSFLTKKTRLWLGRSQVLCFQADQPSPSDRYFSFQVDDKLIHILMPPKLLSGEKIGYMRLQSLAEGKTQVTLQGSKIDVEIFKDTAMNALNLTKPQIVTPASGANVWGDFAVGVEQLNLDASAPADSPVLRLPNGKEMAARPVPDQKPGPHSRWMFDVKAGDLGSGVNRLVAVGKDNDGQEVVSDPLYVTTLQPDPNSIISGLCKDQLSGDRPFNDGDGLPKVANDDKYAHGMIIDNQNENPAWCFPVSVSEKGQYQLFVTARGDIGGDALPTIALMVDEENQPATTARLASTEWHRLPVGHPITLNTGEHMLTVRFRNGFGQGPNDIRGLYLEKYELARVDHPAVKLAANDGGAGNGMDMSMTPGPNMMDGGDGVENPGAFQVAFKDALDGQMVTGQVQVNAVCWWPNREHSPPPRVELYVNKKFVAAQNSGQPQFHIDPASFVTGANNLELRATLSTGQRARSVQQTVDVPREITLPTTPMKPTATFTVDNPAWSKKQNPFVTVTEDKVQAFYANGEASIKLPDGLQGDYKVLIEARGENYQGPPVATLALKVGGQETKLGEAPVGPNMGLVDVAKATLIPGPKELIVRYANDLAESGKGDRNLFVKAVSLEPTDQVKDTIPPLVSVVYPAKNISVGLADAVVARVLDNEHVAAADLLIDDQPQHFDLAPRNGLGPVVFPLLTRDLVPGVHRLCVVAHDDSGNQGKSKEVLFTVLPKGQVVMGDYQRALFLLNRFGYGPEPGELAAILTMGPHKWLESRLAETAASSLEENEQMRLRAEFPDQHNTGQVISGAVQYLLTDANPVRARFIAWTENHFSTWLNKDGTPLKADEHDRFLQMGPAPFADLLLTSATSPAMLIYLDQRNSFSHRLNENYAREIMELHTLGVKGGYTQKDVTTLADLLTGWTLADEAPKDGSGGGDLDRVFRYDPRLNSGTACRILGMEFSGVEPEKRFDRVLMALEMLTAHPSCAQFISRKLCEHYVSNPAPPVLVDDLAKIYLETGGDMRAMLLAMSEHPAFWAVQARVASPIDFGVRASRLARVGNPGPVNDLISRSGMGMFDRATPDGYPEADGDYASSNALLQRWRFAKTIQNNFLESGLIPTAWQPADADWKPGITQRLIDVAAVRMTGNILSDSSNESVQKLLASAPPNTGTRLHALATFICQLPENSLR